MSSAVVTKVLFLYLYFTCDIITSKKLNSPGHGPKLDKLNDCDRCRLLTVSFNHWLDKTSRGKYEGGDAAWEAAKLKSYARSEVRLVEVQEGLCSELNKNQDDCYILAEETEQVLERWWFHEDPSSADLYTWLCIDTLKDCCPLNHYGEFCDPCPLDKENNICSGHGKCDGEGTRLGNGSCLCKRGYTGEYCQDCMKNYFVFGDFCKMCHQSCEGCSESGPAACHKCKSGWELKSGTCIDVNECLPTSPCKPNEYCLNKEGSYQCNSCDSSCKTCIGREPTNCTSCHPNYVLWNNICITENQKAEFLLSSLKRLGLYLGLLIIASFIFRTSKPLASLVILVIAVYIYYSEQSANVSLRDTLKFLLADHLEFFYGCCVVKS